MDSNNPIEYFRISLKHLLKSQGHGAQSRLADALGINRTYLNGILSGRDKGSEEVKSKISDKLGIKYEEMISLGRRLADPGHDDGAALPEPSPKPMPYDDMTFDESVKLLKTIYDSGEPVLIRAIAANLHAFAETVETKSKAATMERSMEAMLERVGNLEKVVERLEQANQELLAKSRDNPGKVSNG